MEAKEYLQQGDLDGALTAAQNEVKAAPAKWELRVYLFQLLSLLGQWERAMTQLNVAGEMDADASLMAHIYGPALNAEAFRAEIFAGKRTAMFLGEPPEWTVWMAQAATLLAQDKHEAAAELRDKAFEAAPAISGTVDGKPFEWIADADPRLGPVLEAIVNGKYYWVPFERINVIEFEKPENLRDAVWARAKLTWANGGEAMGLIPARYVGTENHEDNFVKMARRTVWTDLGSDFFAGAGQRVLTTDEDEYPLLAAGTVTLNCPVQDSVEDGDEVPSDG